MKRALSILAATVVALPLLAADTQKEKKAEEKPAKPVEKVLGTEPSTAVAASAPQQTTNDSPLVAAAKRSNRMNGPKKSKTVITNDTLVKDNSSGNVHVTTTEKQYDLPKVQTATPTPEAEQNAAKAKAADADAKKKADDQKKKDEERKQRSHKMSDAAYDPYDTMDVDPAKAEAKAQELNTPQKPAQTSNPSQDQKPPQE